MKMITSLTSRYFKSLIRFPKFNRPLLSISCCHCHNASAQVEEEKTKPEREKYTRVMTSVPQPVVVVTTAHHEDNKWLKRGITCSSFTSVSLEPPIVSFAVTRHSRMHQLLLKTDKFAVHVLSNDQVGIGFHFARPAKDEVDQFQGLPHHMDAQDLPILEDSFAVLKCEQHSVTSIGDHHMWYGKVHETVPSPGAGEPMLYYLRSFRLVGDESFMKSFEERSMPFEEWTHEAHIRMSWNYVREFGKEEAIPHIKMGIWRFNEKNKDKIGRGYHETVTQFYTHMIADAIVHVGITANFEEFMGRSKYLLEPDLLFRYYSESLLNSPEAKIRFLPPDKQALPST